MSLKTTKCADRPGHGTAIHLPIDHSSSESKCPSTAIPQCDACRRVQRIRSEVDKTIQRLKELVGDLQHADAESDHYHSSRAVDKLIPRILSTIFEISVADALPSHSRLWKERDFNGNVIQSQVMRVPLVFGQICKEWRQVAFSTPRIWTTILLDSEPTSRKVDESDLIHAWISRTGKLPLTVRLYSSRYIRGGFFSMGSETPTLHPSIKPMLEALASSSHQWLHFSSRIPYEQLQHLEKHAENIPFLKTLKITLSDTASASLQLATVGAPTGLLWKAVTTLTVEGLSPEGCLLLIASFPNLTTCTFNQLSTVSSLASTKTTGYMSTHCFLVQCP
ncbi:hypothetical protein CPC08DRAFT_124467 [Agrocybe pediades]|nr:hypothetical protein CPC08DRAFT_124467 [Agrocybe pediades]